MSRSDKLTCAVPTHWAYGFKAAVLDIMQKPLGFNPKPSALIP